MTRFFLILLLIQIRIFTFGQTQSQKDSLILEMCNTLSSLSKLHDSIRLQRTYETHLYPFLNNYSENLHQQLGTSIYYRFQHNCKEFKDLLDRNNPVHEDWEKLSERPISTASSKDCDDFFNYKYYWYYESSGDTVHLKIKNGYWIDYFKDGTYSKLKFHWKSTSKFEIEFIESNNKTMKNFSKPGDRYKYEIISKEDGYFAVLAEIPDIETYMKFKLYFRKNGDQ